MEERILSIAKLDGLEINAGLNSMGQRRLQLKWASPELPKGITLCLEGAEIPLLMEVLRKAFPNI